MRAMADNKGDERTPHRAHRVPSLRERTNGVKVSKCSEWVERSGRAGEREPGRTLCVDTLV